MRLIDADALLEALKEKRKFENIPQYLQDEYKDMPEVLLRKTLRVDEINDLITNAPTVQREGWVSVPIEPTDEMIREALDCQEHDPEDDAKSEVYYMYKAMIQAAPTDKE